MDWLRLFSNQKDKEATGLGAAADLHIRRMRGTSQAGGQHAERQSCLLEDGADLGVTHKSVHLLLPTTQATPKALTRSQSQGAALSG